MENSDKKHFITLDGRNFCSVFGVTDVPGFDSESVVLNTTEGRLTIEGKELKVGKLSIEDGEVNVFGKISALWYSDKTKRKGFFG